MLELHEVNVAYGNVLAVKGLSLTVGRNEIVAIIGNNGAGKSTTLKTISGLLRPRFGQISFEGKRIDRLPVHTVAALGITHVPEGRRIFSRLTVRENLMMGAYLLADRRPVEENLSRVFELFPVLRDRLNQAGGTLSGGEQQMLALGRALMARPKLLLLDEPSLGLAPMVVDRIAEAITEIRAKNIPILLVEQNAKVALELADRGYVMETGQIVLQGPGRQLLEDETVQRLYLGVA